METVVRPALESELCRINELRREVNELHVQGKPEQFRPGFCGALQMRLYEQFFSDDCIVLAALREGEVCGFAVVEIVSRPETPYNNAQRLYRVDEFGVGEGYRRQGVATALVDYMKADAKAKGFGRIDLDMWEFNQGALRFYEQAGFKTTRRYMELKL